MRGPRALASPASLKGVLAARDAAAALEDGFAHVGVSCVQQPLAEVGVPGLDTTAWQMLVAPGHTPRPILEQLNAKVNAIVHTQDVVDQFVTIGLVPIGKGSPTEPFLHPVLHNSDLLQSGRGIIRSYPN